jgi:Ala-tRNA(Pro) deacylase
MTIPRTIATYLGNHEAAYRTVSHPAAATSQEIAEAAGVSGTQVVKGVVLEDADGFLVALLPAHHLLHVGELRRSAGRPLELAREDRFVGLFEDCDNGAVPALATAYGVPVMVAQELSEMPQVYLEAGDHRTLIEMDGAAFSGLLPGAAFVPLSGPPDPHG